MRSRRIPKICRDSFFGWGAHLAQAAFEEAAHVNAVRKEGVYRRRSRSTDSAGSARTKDALLSRFPPVRTASMSASLGIAGLRPKSTSGMANEMWNRSGDNAMSYVERIVANIRDAEEALVHDVHEQQQRWRYQVHRGRIRFDEEVRHAHRKLKQSIPAFLRDGSLRNLLTTPLIYSLALPLLLLDVWVTMYQWICFPVYGIGCVPRRRYFVMDRHRLGYLNAIEKANCAYCSYATGLFAYAREVAARTEHYWCPIKHSRPIPPPHGHYQLFFDYGDAAGYRHGLHSLRKTLLPPNKGPARRSSARRS